MGAWGSGPFDNDGAADLLGETNGSAPALAEVLRRVTDAPADEYLDVDDGQHAIAVCELVALGFGYGKLEKTPAKARAVVRKLGPDESLRVLAIKALPRIRDRKHSEIASLWEHDPAFDAGLADLLARLIEAGD